MNGQQVVKYVAAGGAVVLFLLTIVWLVRSEGERNRAAIREAAERAAIPLPNDVVSGSERAVERAAEAAGQVLREAGQVLQGPADSPSNETPGRPADRAGGRQTKKPDVRPPDAADRAGGVPLADLFGEMVDLAREAVRTADEVGQSVLGLSTEEEVRVGKQLHAAIRREYKLRPAPQRLVRLAAPLVARRTRKDMEYHFFVVEREEFNAFAHAGGYVYVTSKAMNVLSNDLQVQFLVAHEIAHVELGHAAQQITYAARAEELAGPAAATAAQMAYLAVALGYSQDQEFEADAVAFRETLALGHRREAVLEAVRGMAAHAPQEPAQRIRPKAGDLPQRVWHEIDNHFRSHPPFVERIEWLESLPVAGK